MTHSDNYGDSDDMQMTIVMAMMVMMTMMIALMTVMILVMAMMVTMATVMAMIAVTTNGKIMICYQEPTTSTLLAPPEVLSF